jgi:hypothetical protein
VCPDYKAEALTLKPSFTMELLFCTHDTQFLYLTPSIFSFYFPKVHILEVCDHMAFLILNFDMRYIIIRCFCPVWVVLANPLTCI